MKTICLWCGKDHRRAVSLACRQLSRKASALVRAGVPAWVLMGILERFGSECLATPEAFETAARAFADGINGKRRPQGLGPLVAVVAAKKKKSKSPRRRR